MYKWLLFLLAVPAFAQQGPITTQQLNSTYYVKQVAGFYPTIQSAVNKACRQAGATVNIPAGSAPADTPGVVTGGCTTVGLVDERVIPAVSYMWNGTAYVAVSSGGGTGTVVWVSGVTANGFIPTVTDPGNNASISINVDGSHMLPITSNLATNCLTGAGTYLPCGIETMTGDVTSVGAGSAVTTLANTAVTPGPYTNANITVDAKGRVTAASSGSGLGGAVAPFAGILQGTIDGVNRTFTLTNGGTPLTASPPQVVAWDNFPLVQGVGYSLSGVNIVYTTAPAIGDTLWAQGLTAESGIVSVGPAGPAGTPGPSIPGVTSDGALGMNVTGAVHADTLAAGTSVSAPQHCIGSNCITAWPTGTIGANGTNGTNGHDGANSFRGAYAGGTTYALYDAVSEAGSSYVSLVAANIGNDPATSPTQWGILAAAGATGAAGGGATAAQLGDAAVQTQLLTNIFRASTVVSTYLDPGGNGTLNSGGGGYLTSDYIVTTPGQVISFNHAPTFGNLLNFYSSKGAVVGGLPAVFADGGSVTTPAGATLFRFTLNGSAATQMVVYGTTLPSTYVSGAVYDTKTIDTAIASLPSLASDLSNMAQTAIITVNLLRKSHGILGQYDAYGTLVANAQYNTTNFMPVFPGEQLSTNENGTTDNVMFFYNKSLAYIGVGSLGAQVSFGSTSTITVPAGAAYVRGSYISQYWAENVVWVQGSTLPSAYVSGDVYDTATIDAKVAVLTSGVVSAAPFAGTTAMIFGDSITFGEYYTPVMQTKLQLTGTRQLFSGGGGVPMVGSFSLAQSAFTANPTGPSIVQLVASEIAGKSLLIIQMGTNDGSDVMGTISDAATVLTATAATTTFYGDCKMVAATLEAAIAINAPATYPTIVVATPYQNSRTSGAILASIITAEQAVFGGLYGYPVLNWSTQSGINPTNWSATLLDTIHPNTVGGQLLGATLARFIVANAHQ